jgi:hypothetical protein
VSRFFRVLLHGRFREGQLVLSTDSPPTLDLHEDAALAMTILCAILQHHKLARETVPLKQVVEGAKLCDIYGRQKVVEIWFTFQLQLRPDAMRGPSSEDMATIIHASYLLDANDIFY